jgi:D-inositol-3-phosphate glycosyltransferase
VKVALLTGGKDPHYVRGLLRALPARGVRIACVGSDELADLPDVETGHVEFHNLIGRQDPEGVLAKIWRVLRYYGYLVVFAARTDARLFHILWFRKFPHFERTFLNAYFKLLGKKILFTAHNIDDQARDGRKGRLVNRLSLKFLYRVVDHVFVHTLRMKQELVEEFKIADDKVTVVPFGINDVIPSSTASRPVAKQRLGFERDERVLLFFGNIAPYKGIEDVIRALAKFVGGDERVTLVLAGRVKDGSCEPYWRELEALIEELRLTAHVRKEIRYIPDEDVGLLFRASDVSVLPYRRVYQSGVLALSYAQGVPVIVADVGSLKDDVIEGETGLVFRPADVLDLAAKIRMYFASALFRDLETRSEKIREYGAERFSWSRNAELTCAVYERVLRA